MSYYNIKIDKSFKMAVLLDFLIQVVYLENALFYLRDVRCKAGKSVINVNKNFCT